MAKKNQDNSPSLSGSQIATAVPSGYEPALSLQDTDVEELYQRLNERERRLFACDCAELILPVYESHFPSDSRPRQAIAEVRKFILSHSSLKRLRDACDEAMLLRVFGYWDFEKRTAVWLLSRGIDWDIQSRPDMEVMEIWLGRRKLPLDHTWAEFAIYSIIFCAVGATALTAAHIAYWLTRGDKIEVTWYKIKVSEYLQPKRK